MAVTWKKLAFEDDVILKSTLDANTILKADTDNTPAALAVAEQTLVGRKTGGSIAALTASEVRTIINVEDGADVTDAANVASAGAVMESDFTEKGSMVVGSGNGTATLLGKGTDNYVLTADAAQTGGMKWASPGAPAAHATSHKNGGGDELKLNELGEPTAAVAFDGQEAQNMVIHKVADATARNALTAVVGKLAFQNDTLAAYICTVAA